MHSCNSVASLRFLLSGIIFLSIQPQPMVVVEYRRLMHDPSKFEDADNLHGDMQHFDYCSEIEYIICKL